MHSIETQLQARLQAFIDFKVKHPRLEEIDHTLMQAIRGHRTYTLRPLYGASDVGKSTVLKHVAERCRAEETDPLCVPVVEVQASPEDIGASARLDYYRQILAQHLMSVDTPHKPASQLDWLKTLTNRTNVLHVLAGNFDLYDFCHLHGQAGRRMRDLYFPHYHFDTPTECEEFVGALRSLLEHVPLIVDVPGLLTHWRWFGEWSLGCIGVLSDWLVETADALCKRGETTFTIDALQKHALLPDLRARMEREARAGEFKMDQAKAQSEQELQRLLGNPAPVPGTAPTTTHRAHGASVPKASPETHHGTHSQTRVERAAARDSVGDQVQTRNSPTCTFFGVDSIDIKRLLDSGVRLFECPDCARTRTLSPRNGVLRFPAHSKRKTRTPVTSQRWAMEQTIREVVGGESK